MTTDEFFEQHESLKFLVQNLQANVDAMAGELDEASREGLVRCNLIMIRQCFESDPFVKALSAFRRDLRQILHENGVRSNPGWSDQNVVDAVRELLRNKPIEPLKREE